MALKREQSIAVGLGLAAIVLLNYRAHLPAAVDVKAQPPNDALPASSEKAARWSSAALVGLVSLLTMDGTVFVLGGATIVFESWMYRHANNYNPDIAAVGNIPSAVTLHAADSNAGYTPGV